MKVTNIGEARTHLSRLVARASADQEIIIGKAGKPVAVLGPCREAAKVVRKPGSWRGGVKIMPGFDEMDKEIEKLFYGEN